MDSNSMFEKLTGEGKIKEIMENKNDNHTVVELSQKDILLRCMVGVEVCINLLRLKGVCTEEEIMALTMFIKKDMESLFQQD